MANILIATLGESPIVVSATVKALKEQRDIHIDQLYVIYPEKSTYGNSGYDLAQKAVESFLSEIQIFPMTVPYDDINTESRSMRYLQKATGLLNNLGAFDREEHKVYISLAGGRKNMAALLLLPCQFSHFIEGMFHILDNYEGTDQANFYRIEELLVMPAELQLQKMLPPSDAMTLVDIPVPRFPMSDDLFSFIKRPEFSRKNIQNFEAYLGSSDIDPGWKTFFYDIFSDQIPQDRCHVFLSQQAVERFHSFHNTEIQQAFQAHLENMERPRYGEIYDYALPDHFTCRCVGLPEGSERILYYRDDTDIVVCDLLFADELEMLTESESAQIPVDQYTKDHRLRDVLTSSGTLLMPLGESPAIVYQTCKLLKQQGKQVKKIITVYPGDNQKIKDAVRWLREGFANRASQIRFQAEPIELLNDLYTAEDSLAFRDRLREVVTRERREQPETNLWLSISGGRKTMAVYSLLVAQATGIPIVYHTLIRDRELDKKLTEQGKIEALGKLTPRKRSKFLFPETLDMEQFELFPIPILLLT